MLDHRNIPLHVMSAMGHGKQRLVLLDITFYITSGPVTPALSVDAYRTLSVGANAL